MAHSTVLKNFRDGTLVVADGAALTHTVLYEEGNFSASGLVSGQKEVAAYMSRGDLASLRHTNQTFPSGSFTIHLADVSDATDSTLIDALTKQGSWSAATSTLGASAEVYAVSLALTIEGTNHGDSADHSITMDDCHCSVDVAEGDPSSVSVSFTCYGTVTLT
jgi:hypothetical protein|tara:strand:- start:960 stop:1448 length:489 start_codon:yes stop_codon:yes gene_type:complete